MPPIRLLPIDAYVTTTANPKKLLILQVSFRTVRR
jgi:hypothetical protein